MDEIIKEIKWQDLPVAQDAFNKACAKQDFINIEKHMPKIISAVNDAINVGAFGITLGPYEFLEAEKIALELEQKYGYQTRPFTSGINGAMGPICSLGICWKYLPDRTRERLN